MDPEFPRLVNQLEGLIETAAADQTVQDSDLRQLLAFLTKVAQVVDQAFSDVLAVLIEFKYVTVEDYRAGRARELDKQLELLTSRSRYRDAEEICSRLHHLSEQ